MFHAIIMKLEYRIFLVVFAVCIITWIFRIINLLDSWLYSDSKVKNMMFTLLKIIIISSIISIIFIQIVRIIMQNLDILQSIEGGGSGGGSSTSYKIDIFVLFYLFTPFFYGLWLFSFGINELTIGLFTISKGGFYICLAIISSVEFFYSSEPELGKLALGFTLSLAVFESMTALIDGIKRLYQWAKDNGYF